MKSIKLELSVESIENCLKQIKEVQEELDDKAYELCKKLAEIGCNSASIYFPKAAYDGVNDVTVTTVKTTNGYKVVAKGEAVCFIEFGAGVHYSSNIYPAKKPKELSNLGQFGKGNGSNDYWFFTKKPGTVLAAGGANAQGKHPNSAITHGNPPNCCMYDASKDIEDEISKAVKEIFGK